ncbi:hypothetical protein ACS0TY_014146 [Phlomoides rotata]
MIACTSSMCISMDPVTVVVDNGKSDRITVADNSCRLSGQHAVIEYRVIASSRGYTWLELLPLTGRKHQYWGPPYLEITSMAGKLTRN